MEARLYRVKDEKGQVILESVPSSIVEKEIGLCTRRVAQYANFGIRWQKKYSIEYASGDWGRKLKFDEFAWAEEWKEVCAMFGALWTKEA